MSPARPPASTGSAIACAAALLLGGCVALPGRDAGPIAPAAAPLAGDRAAAGGVPGGNLLGDPPGKRLADGPGVRSAPLPVDRAAAASTDRPAPNRDPAWREVRLPRLGIAYHRPADFTVEASRGGHGGRRAYLLPGGSIVLGVLQYRRAGVDGAAELARFLRGVLPRGRLAPLTDAEVRGLAFLSRGATDRDGWVRAVFTHRQDENLLAYAIVARTGNLTRDRGNRATAEAFFASFAPASGGEGHDDAPPGRPRRPVSSAQ